MRFSHFLTIGMSSLSFVIAGQSAFAQDLVPPVPPPALKQILDNTGNLSLTPVAMPLPDELKFGSNQYQPTPLTVTRITQIPAPAAGGESKFLDTIGHVFDAQDSYWPNGVQSSVHIQAQTDDGLRRWVPFVSLAQDADEVDAHVRNGIGAGVTYRFDNHARVDIEGMFLQHSGDENPLLRDETRGMIVFSFDY